MPENPDAPILLFLEEILENKNAHPSLRTMAASVLIAYNKKFGASSVEKNKSYMDALREIVLAPFTPKGSEADDKILEARINAAFQVLR